MALEKKFDATTAEPRLYQAWEAAGCFMAGANAKPEASSYCIMIPPQTSQAFCTWVTRSTTRFKTS